MDVGCGEGGDAIELAERFGVTVTGVDPVQRHVDLGRERADEAAVAEQVTFTLGAAERLPLDDGSADLIWSKEALMYADLETACNEFRRVLRPGGRGFIYQVFTGSHMTDHEASEFWRAGAAAKSVRPEDMERAIEAAGLSVTGRIDFGSEWGMFRQERSGAGGGGSFTQPGSCARRLATSSNSAGRRIRSCLPTAWGTSIGLSASFTAPCSSSRHLSLDSCTSAPPVLPLGGELAQRATVGGAGQ